MADLKFYYHGIEGATFINNTPTSEAPGYPKENLQDRNFNKIWKSTSDATQTIDLDLNEATLSKNFIILHAPNCNADHYKLTVKHDSLSDFSTATTVVNYQGAATGDVPIWLETFTGSTQRYWRIQLAQAPASGNPFEVGNIFLGTVLTHPVPNIKPFSYGGRFDGIKLNTGSGGTRHSAKSFGERKIWTLDWEAIDETHKGYFDTWKAEVEGPHYPFYFADKDGNLYFVRAVQTEILNVETAYQMYSVRIRLEEEL